MNDLLMLLILALFAPRLVAGLYHTLARLLGSMFRRGPVAALLELRDETAAAARRIRELRAEIDDLETLADKPRCVFCASETSAAEPRCRCCGRPNASYLGWQP